MAIEASNPEMFGIEPDHVSLMQRMKGRMALGLFAGAVFAAAPALADTTNTTIDLSFLGTMLNSFTSIIPNISSFIDASMPLAIKVGVILVILGCLFAVKDKIEKWARTL
jgi:hypothetical protein